MIAADFITNEEGLKLNAYQDIAGIWTIGIGSTMYEDGKKVKRGDAVTKEKAISLRDWEIQRKSVIIKSLLGGTILNENQMIALVSFTYNIGIGGLSGSTLLKRIKENPNRDDYWDAASIPDQSVREWCKKNERKKIPVIKACFMMWNKITNSKTGKKETSEALLNRRIREYKLYSSKI